jgi:hypothetical protein
LVRRFAHQANLRPSRRTGERLPEHSPAFADALADAMKGKISMVKEGGAWKLDERGWST